MKQRFKQYKVIFYPQCCALPFTMFFEHYKDIVKYAVANDIIHYIIAEVETTSIMEGGEQDE